MKRVLCVAALMLMFSVIAIAEYTSFDFDCKMGMDMFNETCYAVFEQKKTNHVYSIEISSEFDIANIYAISRDGLFIDSALFFYKNIENSEIESVELSYSTLSKQVTTKDKTNVVKCLMMFIDPTITFEEADKLGAEIMLSKEKRVVRNGYEYTYDGNHIWTVKCLAEDNIEAEETVIVISNVYETDSLMGKMKTAIDIDSKGKIVSVKVVENNDTPGISTLVIDNQEVFEALIGQRIADAQIDVFAGVTQTCDAINDALKLAAKDYDRLIE